MGIAGELGARLRSRGGAQLYRDTLRLIKHIAGVDVGAGEWVGGERCGMGGAHSDAHHSRLVFGSKT